MKLVLRREQRQNLIGKMVFCLDVRGDMSHDEEEAIKLYGLSETLLYEKYSLVLKGWGGVIGRFASVLIRLAHFALNTTVKAKDLSDGKRVQCHSIAEMVLIEKEIIEEAVTLGALLRAAMMFKGEEAIPI